MDPSTNSEENNPWQKLRFSLCHQSKACHHRTLLCSQDYARRPTAFLPLLKHCDNILDIQQRDIRCLLTQNGCKPRCFCSSRKKRGWNSSRSAMKCFTVRTAIIIPSVLPILAIGVGHEEFACPSARIVARGEDIQVPIPQKGYKVLETMISFSPLLSEVPIPTLL